MSRYYFVILTALIFISCFNKNKETYSESSSGLELAMYQEFRMTRDPMLNYVPRERLAEARAYTERISNMIWTGGRLSSLTWQERGPDNVAGRTRAILIDKRDPSGNTVFAGSVSGGIFKTTNFLSTSPTWTKVNDFLPNLAISNIVQDPLYPDTLYATTGEGWFNIDAVRGAGIYKSTDGGNTWSVMPSTAGFE
ncbi:MAG: hypothetical protein N2747_11465, partial [Chitinophagaceae bacterium]|nr:hypothetical protein [Chitinophagaceae bacterium]